MKHSILWLMSALVLGMVLALLPVSAAAQTIWLGPDQANNVTLEWLRPEFEDAEDLSFMTSGFFLSARFGINDQFRLVGDVPFGYFGTDIDDVDSEIGIGNPYLGVEVGNLKSPVWGELGLRIPLTDVDNLGSSFGFFSDYDRCEAFMPDAVSAMGFANYLYRHDSGFSMRLRGGPLFLISTDSDEYEDDMEMYAMYSLQGWYDTARLRFGTGITGRMIATEKDLDLGERTIHQLGLALAGKFRGVEPGLHFRLPLDEDLSDVTNYTFGLTVTVPFQQR